ncbi:hybrid sensor histidine kinase/response regulator [Geomonas sp. Red32]|uniref:hybrid sensor histidine kinase/response regulator n=1 Tax=Geomonas sp. Red32 TaxID=2912856 RepID=UPI00202CF545|nr:hybrid sensor histidine kinase/response regulator [Geomonas sp. Red32]MCM0083293.1 hybrid sensor histidine kinase/response regulator [Geomonas sp. Red32]
MERDAEFQRHLLETFRQEADEHLAGIGSGLVSLERGGELPGEELLETVFREAHSLKGAARSVGRGDIEALCQAMEGLFASLKHATVRTSPELFDLLQQAADLLQSQVTGGGDETKAGVQREIIRRLGQAARGEAFDSGAVEGQAAEAPAAPGASQAPAAQAKAQAKAKGQRTPAHRAAAPSPGRGAEGRAPGTETAGAIGQTLRPEGDAPGAAAQPGGEGEGGHRENGAAAAPAAPETVRVSWHKLSTVLLLCEEMLAAKLSARQRAAGLRQLRASFAEWRKQWMRIGPDFQRIRALAAIDENGAAGQTEMRRLLDFLDWNETFLATLETRYSGQSRESDLESRTLAALVDSLLGEVRKAMMFPFSTLLKAFPKMARDLARGSGKEVDLLIKGEEIEIDRRILEDMKDPLTHLLRNAIGHGIELPEERERLGKPRRGTVVFEIASRDGKAEIAVSDDGSGIDPERVREAVVHLGRFSAGEAANLSGSELLPLIFLSGLSTSPAVDEISGRGLGLAIVREKAEELGGAATVESLPGRGTIFRVVVPVSVATFRGILLRIGDRSFVVPATHVDRVLRLKGREIHRIQEADTIAVDDRPVPLVSLGELLGIPLFLKELPRLQAVVATLAGQTLALLVDEVLGEQEVLLKPLGPQLERVPWVTGAALLGSGNVAPILNLADLSKSATGTRAPSGTPAASGAGKVGRILVVEDSITSRTLLKNILQAGGYQVTTAYDGVDALSKLDEDGFDLVVSDVDMPRLNGLDLTAAIRRHPRHGPLPVILITALGSREDRERGIDAGANAYLVKSRFDQDDLLAVVRRFC